MRTWIKGHSFRKVESQCPRVWETHSEYSSVTNLRMWLKRKKFRVWDMDLEQTSWIFVLRMTIPFMMWPSQKPLWSLCHLNPLFHLPTSNYKHLLRNAKIFLLGRTREKFGLESARDIANWQCGRTHHCVVSHHLPFFTYGVSLCHPFRVQRHRRHLIKAHAL